VILTGGHRNDVTQLLPLLDAIPPIAGRRGRPRRRLGKVYADRGYDHDSYRQLLGERGITPVIARRGTGHGSGLGQRRWVMEGTLAWLHAFRRLRTAMNAAPTPTTPWSAWPARSSASGTCPPSGQGKNPARVCTNHSGSSSQG
jgi:transposase